MTPITRLYWVIRDPAAPLRRAGLVWDLGGHTARLTEAQAAAIAADPGYDITPIPDAELPELSETSSDLTGGTRPARRGARTKG